MKRRFKHKVMAAIMAAALLVTGIPTAAMAATAVEDNQGNYDLKDGTYYVNAVIQHANNRQLSMANEALCKPVKLVVQGGAARLQMEFNSLTISSLKGYMGTLEYLPNYEEEAVPTGSETVLPVTVLDRYALYDSFNDPQTGTDETMKGISYPRIVTMPVNIGDAEIWMRVYVPIMEALTAGSGQQYARLQLDWDSIKAESVLKFQSAAVNKTYGAKAFTNPLTAVTDGKMTFQSSNTSVATVNASGKVTIQGAGTAVITVNAAEGKIYKAQKASYKLNVAPGKAKLTGVKNNKKKIATVTWKKGIAVGKGTANVKYELQYSTNKKFKKKATVTKKVAGSKTKYQIKKLKKGKTYYVRIRAYHTTLKKYGAYSASMKVTIRK